MASGRRRARWRRTGARNPVGEDAVIGAEGGEEGHTVRLDGRAGRRRGIGSAKVRRIVAQACQACAELAGEVLSMPSGGRLGDRLRAAAASPEAVR